MNKHTEHTCPVLTPLVGFLSMAYTQISPSREKPYKPIVCVHGLTRNGRDFDYIAKALCSQDDYTVFSPDVIGRNKSDYYPEEHYQQYSYPNYCSHIAALFCKVMGDKKELDYIGTSMGGIIGMMLAACPNTPIKNLVINDIGPIVNRSALVGIKNSLEKWGKETFATKDEAKNRYCKDRYSAFGITEEEHWDFFTDISVKQSADGSYGVNYDPNINSAFVVPDGDIPLWTFWDLIKCPVLLVRGKQTNILSEECVEMMKTRGPKDFTVVEFENVGHAPSLFSEDQIKAVQKWLKDKQ